MPSRDDVELRISELSDEASVRALTALVEERGLLSAARQLPPEQLDVLQAAPRADVEHYVPPGQPTASDGELARAVLAYAASAQMESAGMAGLVDEAVAYAQSPMDRMEPVALSVVALAVTFLQTEVVVKRDPRGRWSFTIHKRAMRDSSLGHVLTALLSRITSGK
jgi:hypothetical protein